MSRSDNKMVRLTPEAHQRLTDLVKKVNAYRGAGAVRLRHQHVVSRAIDVLDKYICPECGGVCPAKACPCSSDF